MFIPFRGLSPAEVKLVQANYPIYKQIQDITHVPWQALAGVHFRETNLAKTTKVKGGPWQFDPPPTNQTLLDLMGKYTTLTSEQKNNIVKNTINDLFSGGIIAGCWLQNKSNGRLTLAASDNLVMDALWGYNGRVQRNAEDSSYVYNGFDEAHFPMEVIGTINGIPVKSRDTRPGAYTVYCQLKSLFPNA